MNENLDIGLEDAREQIVDVSKELLVLRLAFGKLKVAIAEAAAPINALLVTALQKAVFWATRVVRDVGAVIAALFGVKIAQTEVGSTAEKTGKALKRSLAGFDQLERLNGATGSAGGGSVTTVTVLEDPKLTQQLAAIVAKIQALMEPLRQINFLPLQWNLARLGESFEQTRQLIAGALEWLWYNLMTPFATWVMEQFAPVFTKTLKEALDMVNAALAPLGQGFTMLWQAMQPVFSFIGQTALVVLSQLGRLFGELTGTLQEKGDVIVGIFENVGQAISGLWQWVAPALVELRTQFALSFSSISETVAKALGFVLDSLHGLTEFLAGAFTGDWGRAWEGLKKLMKNAVNGIIGILNGMLSAVVSGINGMVRALNKLKFTAPDWVPEIGGKTFSLNLKTVAAPQIPYLAKGAVLPANKPFLAMVGDQRHGTNIEAPLATISEAVAQVMDGQISALMAGFDATVQELRSLHDTVSGIEVGDTVIGKAAMRYRQKLAIINGNTY